MNPKVGQYLSKAKKWREEMEQLRKICLAGGLAEALKWGKPCYAFPRGGRKESNIAIIQPFKESCALMFFKGALLKDPNDILEKPGEHSRVARRIPFTSVQEIVEMEPTLKAYIQEAIEAEKAGLEVDTEEGNKLEIPKEFRNKMEKDPVLKTAFEALTPGRQRGYVLYFSDAKQSKTRARRIDKYTRKILDGKGLNEREGG